MIKALIFDCFGVLTSDYWKEFLATIPPEQVAKARELNHEYDSGKIDLETFLSSVEKLTGRDRKDVRSTDQSSMPKNLELIKYIDVLKSDYKIGLISNVGTDWVRRSFLSKEEQAMFDAMVLSYEVGLVKPDPRIFELCAEKLGVTLSECVLIDDSQTYIDVARRLGMQAVLYRDFQQMKRDLENLINPKN